MYNNLNLDHPEIPKVRKIVHNSSLNLPSTTIPSLRAKLDTSLGPKSQREKVKISYLDKNRSFRINTSM